MTSSISLSGISGYDFSGITEMLISNYSKPLTKMQNSISALETKQNAWKDVNTRLSALEKTLADLKKTSTWTGTAATSSNENILTVTSDSSTLKGAYSIEVGQLAKAQTAASAVQNVATAATAVTGLTAGTFQITVGTKTVDIAVADSASLKDIADSINNSGVGVNASVIKVSGGYQLAMVSAKTGTENAAAFTDTAGNALDFLGIKPAAGTLNVVQAAQDAELTINGITNITSASNTVTTAIDGLTLTLKQPTAVGETVNVSVTDDFTSAEEAVQAFVDQYNSLMSLIETDLAYDKDAGTKGDLYADPAVKSIQSRLQTMLMDPMGNTGSTYNLLADVGIDTSSENFGKSALLEFDTAKFTEALENDPNSVANLFGAPAGGVTPTSTQGMANILGEYLDPYLEYGGVLDSTESSYSSQISDMKSRMKDFQLKIDAYTERITNKYALLETQLSALSSDSSYMTSMLSSLTTSSSSSDS